MAKNTPALKRAKQLRRRATPAEEVLWQKLRNKKLGAKFRRQMPFVFGNYHFVADFYCARKKLIIELDGGIHHNPEIHQYDKLRQDILKESGYQLIRFKNEEVFNSLIYILSEIKKCLA